MAEEHKYDRGQMPHQEETATAEKDDQKSESLHLFWLDPELGQEVAIGKIDPDSNFRHNSHPEHTWILREGPETTSKIVKRLVMSTQVDELGSLNSRMQRR